MNFCSIYVGAFFFFLLSWVGKSHSWENERLDFSSSERQGSTKDKNKPFWYFSTAKP